MPLLTDDDLRLFNAGEHLRLFDKFGAHVTQVDGVAGTAFAVWAPNAERVFVVGDFNAWREDTPLASRGGSGVWEAFVPGVGAGALYKFAVRSRYHGYQANKADPFATRCETPPNTASVVWPLDYAWGDAEWMAERAQRNSLDAPISIYEVHLGSWRRAEDGRWLTYREMAPLLADYVAGVGFTHVELMPVMEHPFYGSWGYQITGYFAPTSRYGTPQDFMYLVDYLHQRGLGVILDWVPSHFPDDEHGLAYFDGTHLYEHAALHQRVQPEWDSLTFNYGRNEVRSFLISNALFWLETYHADGLRVDAVASMLYLDYGRKQGGWTPNRYGGRENLEAMDFLRRLNTAVYAAHPGVQVIAEESTAWPMVSHPVHVGGLGFGAKWDMGWMHDTLDYFGHDPVHRTYHHQLLTFRMLYAFSENFVLPLSHDEVVHGKRSLLNRMPGDLWRQFANLRLLFAYMYAQPGKKLLFMGGEFGQRREWDHERALDWDLLQFPEHQGVQQWLRDLNQLYRTEPALHHLDAAPEGFEWVDCNDTLASVVSLLRWSKGRGEALLAVFNFTPVVRSAYVVGAPFAGRWRELLNSDATVYGGSGAGNLGGVAAEPVSAHGQPCRVRLTLPPLGAVFLKHQAG
jgi:1,4-alpha-glucan branching enzyme